jgi:hypothetical protein
LIQYSTWRPPICPLQERYRATGVVAGSACIEPPCQQHGRHSALLHRSQYRCRWCCPRIRSGTQTNSSSRSLHPRQRSSTAKPRTARGADQIKSPASLMKPSPMVSTLMYLLLASGRPQSLPPYSCSKALSVVKEVDVGLVHDAYFLHGLAQIGGIRK